MAMQNGRSAVPAPGQSKVNTLKQFYPTNTATPRPNTLNGANMGTIGAFPDANSFNQGLMKEQANLIILAETFEAELAVRGETNYRKYFSKDVIPKHMGTLTKSYMRRYGMDERPETAKLTGLIDWTQEMNEVSIEGVSINVTVNPYGRYYKLHRFANEISKINWEVEIASAFAPNASRTLDNLAGYRMYQGSNKFFVKSVAAFDPDNPLAKRVELGANASEVNAPLTWDTLLEAKKTFTNYKEPYSVVNQANGDIEVKTRKAVIPGFNGNAYAVVLGHEGYDQLLADQQFRATFVVNGGHYAQQVAERTLGLSAPFLNLVFDIVENPITIEKSATPKISTEGEFELEVAFMIGGTNGAKVAVEVSLEGETKMINVGYEEDKKVDFFSMLSIVGWMAVVDYSIIRPEAFLAIPYVKTSGVTAGAVVGGTNWATNKAIKWTK